MSEAFGARLRESRLSRGVTLRAIAEQTKIKQSLLDELERGDVSHWPGGIFRRAFVRAYAQAIGLEPDAVVREFLALYPDPGEDVATIARAALGDVPVGRMARLRAAVGATFRGEDAQKPQPEAPPVVGRAPFDAAADQPNAAPQPAMVFESQPVVFEPQAAAAEEPAPPIVDEAPSLLSEEPEPATLDSMSLAIEPDVAPEPDGAIEDAHSHATATGPSLEEIAQLCTALARVERAEELTGLLEHVVRILDAAGLILWMWDPAAGALRPTLAHGYPASVLAQLPAVDVHDDNATAAACRLGQTCVVNGSDHANGALAVPLLAPIGCGGVLALELRNGRERSWRVRAATEIVAAQLASMMCVSLPAAERMLA